jgi:hypothetical protein
MSMQKNGLVGNNPPLSPKNKAVNKGFGIEEHK